jgi:oxaloacetate decarboxylase beta subunit
MTIKKGTLVMTAKEPNILTHDSKLTVSDDSSAKHLPGFSELLSKIWQSTGIYDVIRQTAGDWSLGLGRVIMILVGVLLIYLAISKGFEPLLLLPIGFGAILSNVPIAGVSGPDGLLGFTYEYGVATGIFPLIIFMGVGAMTDFGPLIANPKTALLGAAAQFGIFFALIGALLLGNIGVHFNLLEASSIGIIGGADGPTSIYLTSKLAPHLLGPIAVAAYSYMALVPIIQPPIMRLLTTPEDRKIRMSQLRKVSKSEKICFPIIITLLCAALLPDAVPLIGMLMFGNLMKEAMVVDRLSYTAQNSLINITTIFLGLTVGSKLSADKFLNIQTLGILFLGLIAFCIGTAAGVLFGQLMKKLSGGKINPLIGAAGVSAVPMAARVVNKVGLEEDPHNFLLMHAMGPNVAGVIGSAVAAGVMLNACKLLQ